MKCFEEEIKASVSETVRPSGSTKPENLGALDEEKKETIEKDPPISTNQMEKKSEDCEGKELAI